MSQDMFDFQPGVPEQESPEGRGNTVEHLSLKKWKGLFHVESAANNEIEAETLQVVSRLNK